MAVRPIFIDCFRDGMLLKTYEYGEPIGSIPGKPQSDEKLKEEAKNDLTNDGLAFPPYDGIRFAIRRS